MFFRVLGLLFLLAAPRAAVSQPLPDRQPLIGRAIDSAGKPLPNVVISLRRVEKEGSFAFWGATTATNARGEFEFPRAETGRYLLDAERAGFAPLNDQTVVWKPGAAPLQLQFQRLVTLTLRVFRPDGTPAAQTALWARLQPLESAAPVARRAFSDETGRAIFAALLPASYSLYLAAAGGFVQRNDVVLRADAALDVTLQKGGSLRVAVRESGVSGRALGGAILLLANENATPDAANIAFLAAQGEYLSQISRDGDGRIELRDIPPGRYRARLMLPGSQTEAKYVEIAAGQNADLSWILPPKDAASLTLQLRSPRANQSITGEMALRLLPVQADGTLGGTPNGDDFAPETSTDSRERRALVDKDGKIVIFPLRAGRYRIFVAPRVSGFALENGPAEAASVDVSVPLQGASAALTLKIP